ncbi:MAG TPA: biotin/lipoyl-containing protein, partial [Gemmatimonadaceae bacterium]|nr:biotin/lipoyl-containing protein [Gemmatimonadaceae bacterium]
MATKVVMEALSPTMEEGRLVKWSKNEGDQIKTGDVLAEVETDKAVMELVARGDGVLRKRLANEGDASPVGTLLAVIANPDENIDSIIGSAAPAGGAPAQAPAQPAQAQAAQPAQSGAPPNKTVAETKESAPGTPVPPSPTQAQGEASTAPQQKVGGSRAGPPPPPPSAPPRPAPPRPSGPPPAPPPRGNGAARPGGGGGAPAAGGRQRSSPLARRLASEKGIQLGG